MKDPEIKLFGKKIALRENGKKVLLEVAAGDNSPSDSGGEITDGSDSDRSLDGRKPIIIEESVTEDENSEENQETAFNKDCPSGKPQVKDQHPMAEELSNLKTSSDSDENSNTSTMDEDFAEKQSPNTENEQSDTSNSQQKTLKKPDKILPCPRCNSMDTKFCYYNNYNINQPRHFCKSCQRYWTAGGTMRNVPVGAGRRKNKNSASNCRHMTISEALQAARIDTPNGFHHLNFKPNGTVLSFGSDSPLCDSMASVLNLAEKKAPNGTRNGFYKLDRGISVSCKGVENGDDCSTGSSVATSNSMVDGDKNGLQAPAMQQISGFPSPVPCLPGVPWPFPWNSAVPLPAVCPSGFPMPFYPTPFWNCGVPGPWSIPWLPPVSPTGNQKSSGSGPNSPTLGKHSRDGELLKSNNPGDKESLEQKKSEGSILVPKTLRIDDPDEAAKSSIWTTLGIKYDSISRGGLFNARQQKGDEKKHLVATSPMLQANPAALSRYVSFQESA
ncbi:hypothetical protein ACH5RR_007715 [Cinchona calisaya]|uniref:Dof-type domain-containing protein n=1 Tax=Cinchona calisaya TaxID=153742 RepID=A0ABD3AFD3_9GENT